MVLEETLESPLDSKEIKPVSPKRNQAWIVIGRTDAEAEAPILWPPDAKSQLIGKHSGVGKNWRQEGKGTIEDKMLGWHHWLNGHEFERTPGNSEGQGSLVCYSPWGQTQLSNWTATIFLKVVIYKPVCSIRLRASWVGDNVFCIPHHQTKQRTHGPRAEVSKHALVKLVGIHL